MKKTFSAAILFTILTASAFAQSEAGLLNINKYATYFLNDFGVLDKQYTRAATESSYNTIAALSGNQTSVDTSLEIVLLSCSAGLINIRPAQAAQMLPANNPKQTDMKLGAAVFQEMQVFKFFGNTAAGNRCEVILKTITDRKNVKRADIEKYYRSNIRALVTGIVDEEFNKVSFSIENSINRQTRSYGGVLTRNPQNGQYTLSYERTNTRNSRKEISGASQEALLAALSQSGEFSQSALDTVRAQAALMPSVALSNNAFNEIKTILINFYTKPNKSTYTAVVETYKVIDQAMRNTGNPKYAQVSVSYQIMLSELGRDFAQKVFIDERTTIGISALSKAQQQKLLELR